MKSNKFIIKLICILILLIFLIQNVNAQFQEDVNRGIFTKIVGFFKSLFGIKNEYEKNLELCEEFKEKMREYNKERNERIIASQNSTTEPPFNSKICAQSTPIDENTKWDFCSCGDGVCASYEYIGGCILDCGSCPEGTFFWAGECIDFVPNSCTNLVCDEGEEKTCPCDCPIFMEEEEEFPDKPKKEFEETLPEEI